VATIIYGFSPPVGFDSQEPVRLRIMGVLATRLAALTVGNGYHYEFPSVCYGQTLRAEPYAEPQISLWDQDETRDSQTMGGGEWKSLIVEVEAYAVLDDPVSAEDKAAILATVDETEREGLEAIADRARRTLIARTNNLILCDVQRAMFEDPLTHEIDPFLSDAGSDLADNMTYESSTHIFGLREHLWAGNVSQWVISYHSVRGKPHLLQEE
jgi:hypothetical protein